MPDRESNEAPALAIDEFMANIETMNAGVAEMMATALRVQMLMLEDTNNMLNEFGAVFEAAAQKDGTTTDRRTED